MARDLYYSPAAVYRPWVWFQLGDIFINHPGKGNPDNKFQWLKEFRYTFGAGAGAHVEFTVFDNRPEFNQSWLIHTRQSTFPDDRKPPISYVKFQWGMGGRDISGNAFADVPRDGSFSDITTSVVHQMILSEVQMEYVEGGINYRLGGTDLLATPGNLSTEHDKYTDVPFKTAVETMLNKHKELGDIPKDFQILYDKNFDEKFKDTLNRPDTWECGGFAILAVLQKWLSQLFNKWSASKTDHEKIGPIIIPLCRDKMVGIRFSVSSLPFDNYNNPAGNYDLIIDVNPPDANSGIGSTVRRPGRHTAITFSPAFQGQRVDMMVVVPSAMGGTTTGVTTASNQKNPGIQGAQGAGNPISIASPSLDRSLDKDQKIEAMEAFVTGVSQQGQPFQTATVEVELLGIPFLDDMEVANTKVVQLYVWNPFALNSTWNGTGDFGWKPRTPPLDDRYPRNWIVNKVSHFMTSEGSYTTSLSLVPLPSGIGSIGGKK